MKKYLSLITAGLLLFSVAGYTQMNTDSMAIVAKISEYQLKLGKLQNTVPQKMNDKQNDSAKAQQSADANARAANSLSANPQDKTDARQADRAASNAKGDSKAARKAANRLNDLNKDILDLQTKISEQQLKLSQFTRYTAMPAAPIASAQPDTTQHI